MPNWCFNNLTVTGPAVNLAQFKTSARGTNPWTDGGAINPLNFDSLMPIPKEVLEAGYNDEGHSWEVSNWGCKWGARYTTLHEQANSLVYGFLTAWEPPKEFLVYVSNKWPTLTFHLDYSEPIAEVEGSLTFSNGEELANPRIAA